MSRDDYPPVVQYDTRSNLEAEARFFATMRHGGIDHVRKYTGEPYVNHLKAVVELVRSVPHTPEMIAAAWLHDVVEDTDTTIEQVEREFGAEVAELVAMLTDVSKYSDGKRAARKMIDLLHTAEASPAAKTIKLADLIDNSVSITRYDKSFAQVYMKEKAQLLEVLRAGDHTLLCMAQNIVQKWNEHAGE